MGVTVGKHPILGPGFGGVWGWFSAVLLLGFCFLLGIAVTYFNPLLFGVGILAIVALVAFVYFSVAFPLGTLCIVVACQILVPVYVRLPLGLPPPLLMLAVLIAVVAVKKMLVPVPSKPGKYEHLVATVLILYNVALLITIPSEHATTGSYLMLVKTVIIPTSLFFAILATVKTPQQLLNVYRAITIAAVLCGMLGVHEFVTKQNFVADLLAPEVTIEEDFFLFLLANAEEGSPYISGSIYRVFSFFTQPLEYSAFMVMTFPFAVLMFVKAKSFQSQFVYGMAAAIIFAGFIVSFSRGPTLALTLVILFLGVFERRMRAWILAGTAGLITGLIVYWPLIVEKLAERVTGSENITLRFSLWENGIKIFLQNPLRGIGYGSYPNYHVQSIRDNQIGPMYEYRWAHIERVTTVENIFVTLAAETGLIGLTAFALLLGVVFHLFMRVYRRCDDELTKLLALSAFAACLGFLLSGMTVANIIGYTISILFFGVYIASLAILSRQLPEGRPVLYLEKNIFPVSLSRNRR